MIAATIIPLVAAGGDPAQAVALASMLALMVGAIMILGRRSRSSGSSPTCSPSPPMIGYMNGLALTIVVGQLPKLFGFSVDGDGLIDEATGFVAGRRQRGNVSAAALAVGLRACSSSWCCSGWLPKIPGRAGRGRRSRSPPSSVFDLADRGVNLVGELPQGFPPFTIPDDLAGAICRCCSPARSGSPLVSLTDTISTASAFAARAAASRSTATRR